MSRKRIFTAA